MNTDPPRPAWQRPAVPDPKAPPPPPAAPEKAKRPEPMPPPILIPVSPGRRGVYEPVYPRPSCAPPQVRYPQAQKPPAAPRRPTAARPRSKPSQDAPTERIPRMTLEERRKRLLEILLDVEANLQMLDEMIPF